MTKALTIMVFMFGLSAAIGQVPDKTARTSPDLKKTAGDPRYTVLSIGNLTSWHRSDGQSNHSPGGDNGTYFPRGTGNVIYQDGIIWGGKAFLDPAYTQSVPDSQTVRVGGNQYTSSLGTRAGYVMGSGTSAVAANPINPEVRIYRIRRDYEEMSTNDLRQDAAAIYEIPTGEVSDAMISEVISQYNADWDQWPVQYGAPYIDRNGQLGYQKPPPYNYDASAGPLFTTDDLVDGNYDEPGIAGADRGLPADQVIFTIFNDLNESQALSFKRSLPLGLEIQKTVWGYKNSQMYFSRHMLINKGGVDTGSAAGPQPGSFYIDSLYIGQWFDADLGSFSDDLTGCDTVLQLGYVYNANEDDGTFRSYSLPPPAAGYVYHQGPAVSSPGDTAMMNFEKRPGFRNLPLSSFIYFGPGSPYSDPPNNEYSTTTGQWWKLLRGFAPIGSMNDPDLPYAVPPGYPFTSFPLSGDPVAGSGHIDGLGTTYSFPPGDRRSMITSGPARLAPGDTLEVLTSLVAGLGADRLSSISVMKETARIADEIYERGFVVPKPPPAPGVRVTELDREILLDWGWDQNRVKKIESDVIAEDYRFEGYNVYQLPSKDAPKEEWLKAKTFDVKNNVKKVLENRFDSDAGTIIPVLVQEGEDNGVQRFMQIDTDYLIDRQMRNGEEYYFAVTAYNYTSSSAAVPRALESEATVFAVKPRIPFGVQVTTKTGDSVSVSRVSGTSSGSVAVLVVDPTVVTGDTYEVRFRSTTGGIVWDLVNTSQSSTPVLGETNQAGDGAYMIVDGIQVKVQDAPNDFLDFQIVANAGGALNPPDYGAFRINASGFPTTLPGSPIAPSGSFPWGIHVGGSRTVFSYQYFRLDISNLDSTWDEILDGDFELRFTGTPGKAQQSSTGNLFDVPFELWNIRRTPNDPSDDYRMIPSLVDSNGNGVFDFTGLDHSISVSDNDPETDYITWYAPANKSPGQAGYNAWVSANGASGMGPLVMNNMTLVLLNGGSVSDPSFPANVSQSRPADGTIYRILSSRRNSASDVFSFTPPSVQRGINVEKASAKRVGVFPNPYYGNREQETSAWRRFVTFNNLPPKVTIRIFNLAGHLVRILEKNDPSQFLEWDLTNTGNWQVASGIYVCHVEMPEIGETKILKVAVIQSQFLPPY